jgi:hypothetical protein
MGICVSFKPRSDDMPGTSIVALGTVAMPTAEQANVRFSQAIPASYAARTSLFAPSGSLSVYATNTTE